MLAASAHAQTQTEMNADADADFRKADAELNAIYAQAKAALDKEGRAKLVTAQRAWLAYRDAQAALEADSARGGSMAPMLHAMALTELTETRTAQLRKLAEPDNEAD